MFFFDLDPWIFHAVLPRHNIDHGKFATLVWDVCESEGSVPSCLLGSCHVCSAGLATHPGQGVVMGQDVRTYTSDLILNAVFTMNTL